MEAIEGKGKKGLIKKTFETCKSIASGMGNKRGSSSNDDLRTYAMKRKSKSWPRLSSSSSLLSKSDDNKCKIVVPQGCFSVYVGVEKQRFVMKTRFLNHPLFKMLLEEAESEYGFNSEGPLALPCDVNLFVKVLAEMDSEEIAHHLGCSSFARSPISHHPLANSRLVAINLF
ncbi:hypothetical protein Leryth_023128 [Lithospermum erythrorhizon]|uniref:Uncharacterized protein n=1 Tax=Lithospermum erythrorhizon TaxID=34254 RepID=A0AAV3R8R5_LITER|nr:hypothetical protein Leryth_023128 [Lithospermum erythrorhizon]